MNTKFLVIRFLTVTTIVSSFFMSCDDDISEVGGSSLIGSELLIEEASDFIVNSDQIDVTKPQTNNLDYYLIGDNDHGFGNTKYSILTQLDSYSVLIQESYTVTTNADEQDENGDDVVLSTTDIDYELVSAELVLPLRYNAEDDEDGDSTTQQYGIESTVSGSSLRVSIYESDYILQKTAPNDPSGAAQKYYGDGSDGVNEFGDDFIKKPENLIAENYEATLPNTGDSFSINLYYDEDTEYFEEGDEYSAEGISGQFTAIRIPLDDSIERILEIVTIEGQDENEDDIDDIDFSRITDENFTTDVFKGLYIETTTEDGIVEILDFDESFVNAGIKMVFIKTTTFNDIDGDDDDNDNTLAEEDVEITTEEVISTLKFSESPINILKKTSTGTEGLPETTSKEEIVLQSGLGRIGTIDLFSDDELSKWRADNILLNDAVIELTVNMDDYDIEEEDLPDTIFITELENGAPIADYLTNFLSSDDDNETLKAGHLISIRDEDDSIIKNEDGNIVYKINITEHLATILRQDEDIDEDQDQNNTLALSVSEDLNIILASDIYNPDEEQFINQGALLCFKTVPLYGSGYGSDENEDDINKRPRLTIKFTPTK